MAVATLDPNPNVEQLIIEELTLTPRHIDDLVNILYRKHRVSEPDVKEKVFALHYRHKIIRSALGLLELAP